MVKDWFFNKMQDEACGVHLVHTAVQVIDETAKAYKLEMIAKAIKKYSRTSDSAVEIADKLVNKCCRVLLINDSDGSRWDGR